MVKNNIYNCLIFVEIVESEAIYSLVRKTERYTLILLIRDHLISWSGLDDRFRRRQFRLNHYRDGSFFL